MASLAELLMHPLCALRSLDVSHTKIDGWELTQALRSNSSLTSLDVRGVPRMLGLLGTLGEILHQPGSVCRLSCRGRARGGEGAGSRRTRAV